MSEQTKNQEMKDPETKTPETNNNEAAPRQETAPEAPKAKEHKESRSEKRRLEALEEKIKKLEDERAQQDERYKRLLAEYDNFRKRSQKEKDGTYLDAQVNTVAAILPVLDNLERAAQAEEASEGVKMILKQFRDILTKAGVAPCGAEGETFDPNLHNAVMHEDGEGKGDTVIAQVLQKGYTMKDRLIRAAMVKTTD